MLGKQVKVSETVQELFGSHDAEVAERSTGEETYSATLSFPRVGRRSF